MISFPLTLQILNDDLSENIRKIYAYHIKEAPLLEDVRLFLPHHPVFPRYVYCLASKDIPLLPPSLEGICFLAAGKADPAAFPEKCCGLFAEDLTDPLELLVQTQEIFEKYRKWNEALHSALEDPTPLDAMLKASRPIFRNPIFVHDTAFNILSCSHRVPGMAVWEQNSQTGQPTLPLSLINDFRVDPAYLHTLITTEPSMYPPEQRGYPILYMNIWQDGQYEGRICVNEMENPILPGHFFVIEHLVKLILLALKNRRLMQFNQDTNLKHFFTEYFSDSLSDHSLIFKVLRLLDWKRNDSYLCLRLEGKQQDSRMMSSAAVIGHLETQVPGSFAFVYQSGISAVVNLTHSNIRIPDVLSSLAILLRESLMKMGASTEIQDFLLLPQGHYQAVCALDLGLKSSSMNWCFRFDDLFLEYLHAKAAENLSPGLLCSHKLILLKAYDRENHTELYTTLKIFLELERNVLQTAKTLFIHRSTLFYRLERICKIADVDLDNEKERLILRISFYFMDLEEQPEK